MRHLLPKTYDLMVDLSRAVSVADVEALVRKRAALHGATSLLAGIVPKTIVKPEDQPAHVVLGRWPEEWAQRYFARQYVRMDPTIEHVLTNDTILAWKNIRYDPYRPATRRIMDEARSFDLKTGVTIPLNTLDGARIGVSYSGMEIDLSPDGLGMLTALSIYGAARALEIQASVANRGVQLTPRERECLLWLSEGKTTSDIGTILSLSIKTVEKHLAAARDKLKALNSTHAVVQALKLGLLN